MPFISSYHDVFYSPYACHHVWFWLDLKVGLFLVGCYDHILEGLILDGEAGMVGGMTVSYMGSGFSERNTVWFQAICCSAALM